LWTIFIPSFWRFWSSLNALYFILRHTALYLLFRSQLNNLIFGLLLIFYWLLILLLFLILNIIWLDFYSIFERIRVYLAIVMQILTIWNTDNVMEISFRIFKIDLILSIFSMTFSKFIFANSDIMLNFIRYRMDGRSSFDNLIEPFPVSGGDKLVNGLNSTIQSFAIALIIKVDINE